MAVAVIWASPNHDGLTAAARSSLLEGVALARGEADVLHLNSCAIERCLACGDGWGRCRSEGSCVIEDDFADLYRRLADADGIVWITPVYWHDLAECLKSFVDRLRRCETAHNHSLQGKKCMLVACAGGTGRGAIKCLDRLEDAMNHMGVVCVERLPVIRFGRDYMLPALTGAGQAFTSYISQT